MTQIKKISQRRYKEYKSIRLEALRNDPSAFGSSFEEEKNLSPDEWKRRIKNAVFALFEDKIVGMIVYTSCNLRKSSHVASIYGLYVTNEYRSRGIGNLLLGEAIKRIQKNKKILKITLQVNKNQKEAVKLYKKSGFRQVGILKKELYIKEKFYDELIMERHL